jgi:hypothetical protein
VKPAVIRLTFDWGSALCMVGAAQQWFQGQCEMHLSDPRLGKVGVTSNVADIPIVFWTEPAAKGPSVGRSASETNKRQQPGLISDLCNTIWTVYSTDLVLSVFTDGWNGSLPNGDTRAGRQHPSGKLRCPPDVHGGTLTLKGLN